MTGVTDEGGGTPAQGELFAEDDLGTAPEIPILQRCENKMKL